MRIYLASDIHNEFSVFNFPVLENEKEVTLVLAGDIFVVKSPAAGLAFFRQISPRFKQIVVIMGNHEFYKGGLQRSVEKERDLLAEFPNVHFLQRQSVVLDGVRFIGTTLWTDFNKSDPHAQLAAMDKINGLRDYKRIRTGPRQNPYGRTIRASDIFIENLEDRKFIAKELAEAQAIGQKAVVVTHHAPHEMSKDKARWNRAHLLDWAYFNTGLEDMILDYKPVFWFHGHTHSKADYMIGDTRFGCNPRGYDKSEKNPNAYERPDLVFDTSLFFEL